MENQTIDLDDPNREQFTVWIFFPGNIGYHKDLEWVNAETAIRRAKALTLRPAAQGGMIDRIRITDGGDFTIFEWKNGQGVVYPPRGADGKFYAPAEEGNGGMGR